MRGVVAPEAGDGRREAREEVREEESCTVHRWGKGL